MIDFSIFFFQTRRSETIRYHIHPIAASVVICTAGIRILVQVCSLCSSALFRKKQHAHSRTARLPNRTQDGPPAAPRPAFFSTLVSFHRAVLPGFHFYKNRKRARGACKGQVAVRTKEAKEREKRAPHVWVFGRSATVFKNPEER